jgi:hypothetical protein
VRGRTNGCKARLEAGMNAIAGVNRDKAQRLQDFI